MPASPKTFRSTLLAVSLAAAFAVPAHAAITATTLPSGANITASAGVAPTLSQSGNALNIGVGSNSVIHWSGGFNIGSQAQVNINNTNFSGTNPYLLNVDDSGAATEIAGRLNSTNVNVLIANANGITIDGTAAINTTTTTNTWAGLDLMGAQVSGGDQAFVSGGVVSFTDTGNAPVNIAPGAVINTPGSGLTIVGSQAITVGSNAITSSWIGIYGGPSAADPYTVQPNANDGMDYGHPSHGGFDATAVPTTITIASGVTLSNVATIRSSGDVLLNGNVSAINGGNSIMDFAGGNIYGPGSITSSEVIFNHVYGSMNNGNANVPWPARGLRINAPATGSNGQTYVLFFNLQGQHPQMINLYANAPGGVYYGSSLNTIGAANGGSHLVIQGSDTVVLAWTGGGNDGNGTPPVTVSGQDNYFSFPGLIMVMAGSDGQGHLNATDGNIWLPPGLDNVWSANEPAGNGIWLQASGQIQNIGGANSLPVVLSPNSLINFSSLPINMNQGGAPTPVNVSLATTASASGLISAPANPMRVYNYFTASGQ